jgi:hypothetical protein
MQIAGTLAILNDNHLAQRERVESYQGAGQVTGMGSVGER